MDVNDTAFAADLHYRDVPGGFFVDLGTRFLRANYRSFITSPASVALIGEQGGRPVGFLVGTVGHAAHSRHVARSDRTRLAVAGALAILPRPRGLGRFARTRLTRYVTGLARARRLPRERGTALRVGVHSTVAVDETARRSGVGRILVNTTPW